MTTPHSLRTVLIGSDSLLVQCGEMLLREGHSIAHVVTDQDRIADWARSQSIEVLDATGDFAAALRDTTFDCLFSITWLSIISDEVLAMPSRYAINFHDGPLPSYAGLYTPAWAIKNGEEKYGVTWHAMVSGVDRGEIFEQEFFDVAPAETSLTINTRCFEAGVASFQRLVQALSAGTLEGTPQDESDRSYFGKFARPHAACNLDWSKPATELEALVRALDFGRYPNPLGTPKLSFQGELVSVTSAEVREGTATPGTVVSCNDHEIVVATGKGALALTGFAHACSAPLTAAELIARWSLVSGATFDVFGDEKCQSLTEFNGELARHEAFWTRRLEALEPLELPWSEKQGPTATRQRETVELTIPDNFSERYSGEEFSAACHAAIGGYLARIGGKHDFHVGYRTTATHELRSEFDAWVAPVVPFAFSLELDADFARAIENAEAEIARVAKHQTWMRDTIGRAPALRSQPELARGAILPIEIVSAAMDGSFDEQLAPGLSFVVYSDRHACKISYDSSSISSHAVASIQAQLEVWFHSLASGSKPLAKHDLLPEDERGRVLVEWNATHSEFESDHCVHQLFERQAMATPDAIAVVFGNEEISYSELNERANKLAHHLIELGVGPDQMVGVNVERSVELMVAVMGVLKAGGAYVPLDPEFPAERIAFMIEDARASVIVSQASLVDYLPKSEAAVVSIDGDHAAIDAHASTPPQTATKPQHLAYAIYTSGSTGKPKGVLVEHGNVSNFFTGMDERIGEVENGVWLAVTSLSFDISVLELLWTACRGFKTVIYGGLRQKSSADEQALDFGLSFFASNRNEDPATQYDFLLDSARFADTHGFASIWTPERHFHAFGGLYPNPSVTSAAIAAITENIHIRSGSVVVALHHPIRIAEEWSLVDNLSKGRVGISIASGWHPNDFVLAPDCYADRKNLMIENTTTVRKLWRGEAVGFPGPDGTEVQTRIMPRPIQPELPVWVTAAGNPDTFRQAGELGANVLTHLLGQSIEELSHKLEVYHQAWKDAGHAGRGRVSIMLHTFIGEDVDEVREIVRGPMREYLRSAVDLIKNHVSSWSAVKKSVDGGKAPEIGSLEDLPAEDIEALLDYSFERYFESSALFGTPERAFEMLESLHGLGIDEITCLVDFGVPCQQVLDSLPKLDELRQLANQRLGKRSVPLESIGQLIQRHGVTHMQCTPSMATLLVEDTQTAESLAQLDVMMVGGEPFPTELARRLGDLTTGRVLNMYGPTETTIWSSTTEVHAHLDRMTIGTPIANTQLYILDANLEPVPVGVVGELYIGGAGVTRGYHERPELTVERFVANPFRDGERMYRTGDVARWLESGEVDFQGRIDHQVKVRGYRIELGEIEAALSKHDHVAAAVVVPRELHGGSGATQLVAFVIANETAEPTPSALSGHLAHCLPEYMIPEEFNFVSEYPLTPNKKIDRKALANSNAPEKSVPEPVASPKPTLAKPAPADGEYDVAAAIETILAIWRDVLGSPTCGPDENFFDLGGHSLLTIRVQKAILEELDITVPLVDMFRFTTVRGLAEHLSPKPTAIGEGAPSKASQRAARRRRRAS